MPQVLISVTVDTAVTRCSLSLSIIVFKIDCILVSGAATLVQGGHFNSGLGCRFLDTDGSLFGSRDASELDLVCLTDGERCTSCQ